jgi:hypothetical protein
MRIALPLLLLTFAGCGPNPHFANQPVKPPTPAEEARARAIGSAGRPLDATKDYAAPDPSLRVTIVGVRVGSVTGMRLGETVAYEGQAVSVECRIENTSKDVKLDYDPGAPSQLEPRTLAHARLIDIKGNAYENIIHPLGSEADGRVKRRAVLPGESFAVTLVHQKPIPGLDLSLKLPLRAFKNYRGSIEEICFRIPASMVK